MGTLVFQSLQKPTFPKASSILECTDICDQVLVTPWCSMGKQMLLIFLQVDNRLKELEGVNTFTDFVQAFSQFGSDMVELAHLSGDRQNVSTACVVQHI